MHVEVQKEHHWLRKLVGEWTYESDCPGEPGQPPTKFNGTEKVRMVGEIWAVGEGSCPMPGGGEGKMVLTLGYDPQKKKYVGTWFGSMMTNLWVYEGTVDASGKKLTLETEGPNFTDPGKTSKYHDIIEFKSDNERTLTSQTLGDDGKWVQFNQATYRRKS